MAKVTETKSKTKAKGAKSAAFKAPASLQKSLLVDLYDSCMVVVRDSMEIGDTMTVETDIGTFKISKIVNPLGVSDFSTAWSINDMPCSKAIVKFLLGWHGKTNGEETNKRMPQMKPAVRSWLNKDDDHKELIVEGMFPEPAEKTNGKGKPVTDDDDDDDEPVAPPKVKGKGKGKAVEEKPADDDDDNEGATPEPPKTKGKAKGKAKKAILTAEELETEVKKKAAKAFLAEILDEDEVDGILSEAFGDEKKVELQEIVTALEENDFDMEDEEMIQTIKDFVATL